MSYEMATMRTLYQIDSFTLVPFTGNPAGVVLEADGLTDVEMLAIARELNNSETAFVFSADAADHDIIVRFFTPITEVPTCGHATIGAHFARAVEYGLSSCSLVQKTGTGLRQRVEIYRNDNDSEALKKLSSEVGSNGFFVFTRDTGENRLLTWARMFAPAIGITEDPVTGNGHGPLGAYLLRHGIVPAPGGKLAFTGRQGEAIGRAGEVHVSVETRTDGKLSASIRGDAATAFRGVLAPAATTS
jgi:predicted PhzF superfamily epimerase YddE/YHI9